VLASTSPLALRGTKAALNFSRDNDLAHALHEVAERNIPLLSAPDIAEALSAQRAGRPPRYPD
jgi:enoyl-CoA hydratase/carnithine racemase